MNKKTTQERGEFKSLVKQIFFKSADIIDILLDEDSYTNNTVKRKLFLEHVKSHLCIDNILEDKGTYIFFDVAVPEIQTQTKDMKMLVYCICHRDLLDDTYSKDGYSGNRADILSQMVENALLDKDVINEFGIGELSLDAVDLYNGQNHYGVSMVFTVPCFR